MDGGNPVSVEWLCEDAKGVFKWREEIVGGTQKGRDKDAVGEL